MQWQTAEVGRDTEQWRRELLLLKVTVLRPLQSSTAEFVEVCGKSEPGSGHVVS